jgi:cytosine/adenosine deaminase-related metal-dependent hydrolase
MSGAVNAHTHLYSGLAPLGMPVPAVRPASFVEILRTIWWRLDRALDEASLRASADLYLTEARLAGTTTLIDHHESPSFIEGSLDVLADAAERAGVRLAVCYGATERNGGRDEARRGLAECRRFAEENRRPLVRAMVGLHASFTVSDATIREAGELARALGTVVHVHVAEDRADVDDARARGYAGPLERLLALGGLPRGSILAHGVHVDAAQVRKADDAGLWLVQNPRSNEGNGVGYPRALGESARVAIGTDGYPADMPTEHAALERAERAHRDAEHAHVRARIEGGARLARELFGAALDVERPELAPGVVDAVLARAREGARRGARRARGEAQRHPRGERRAPHRADGAREGAGGADHLLRRALPRALLRAWDRSHVARDRRGRARRPHRARAARRRATHGDGHDRPHL